MNKTTHPDQSTPDVEDTLGKNPSIPTKHNESEPQLKGASRFEKFAATQASGDGIQGDALKKDKTVEEKIGANMADRK